LEFPLECVQKSNNTLITFIHCSVTIPKELKEEKEHAKGMTHANSALRNASTTTTARMQTLSEALRIAGEKAANARADAEASEVRASSLASQLKNFKNVLDETKRTVETIRAEHDDISSAARDLEAKLLQKESELSRVERQKAKSDKEHRDRCVELKDLKETESLLTEHLGKRNDELAKLKKIILEREHIEKARLEMTDRLEQELRKSRSIIVELTSSAAETESTATELQETIQALQEANESLHDKIKENSEKAEKEKAKLHESLTEAENEAQKLRLKAAVDDEELQKVRLDKNSNEKEVQQLKIRLLAKANSVGVIGPGDELGDVSSLHSDLNSVTPTSLALPYKTPGKVLSTKSPHEQFSIPKLKSISPRVPSSLSNTSASMEKVNRPVSSSNSSSNNRRRPVQTNCSICFKASYGIMKACQCGDPKCALRAHATCISGKKSLPSVSHPGNPSPALPAILCLRKK
jgi:myosin heavy subunit